VLDTSTGSCRRIWHLLLPLVHLPRIDFCGKSSGSSLSRRVTRRLLRGVLRPRPWGDACSEAWREALGQAPAAPPSVW
jgi:hypothetical protein